MGENNIFISSTWPNIHEKLSVKLVLTRSNFSMSVWVCYHTCKVECCRIVFKEAAQPQLCSNSTLQCVRAHMNWEDTVASSRPVAMCDRCRERERKQGMDDS